MHRLSENFARSRIGASLFVVTCTFTYATAKYPNEVTEINVGFLDPQNVLFRWRNMCQCRYVFVFALFLIVAVSPAVVREKDICGPHNGRRLYLELGEQGILYAKNVSFIKNAPNQQATGLHVTNSSHDRCSLELVTCPSCIINVTFKSISLSHHCGDGEIMIDGSCRCDYVWISEPPYEDVSGVPFCGQYSPITYRSSTRTLSIALLYSQSHSEAFTLEYTAERNRLQLTGTKLNTGLSKSVNNTGGGILSSPFFPARYPRDLGMEYVITCPTETPSCRVRILFSDFQLATVSIVEFYDWNGQRLDVSNGARFRPPIIVSSGPSLLIRFYANGGTGLGYKAFYSFIVVDGNDKATQPITDCGGYVENLGGAITMMDMVEEGIKTFDCVWLIRPPTNFLHMKTHMYLKVVTFANMAGTTEMIIKQGPTSALLPLEILRHPASQILPPRLREHIAPVASGFHVSLRGSFGPTSRLAIAYAAFSYTDCFAGSDFLCQNHRCISTQLNCDGFDHCGDDSDEPATCFNEDYDSELDERKWHINKANYYFPKIDRYPDLKTATLVFLASSLGLIILISALIVLLYRIGARTRQQRELQSRLQTISELLDGSRIDEITVSDDPPVYEAPPGYDEVIKVNIENDDEDMNAETRRKKRRPTRTGHRRSKSTPNQHTSDQQKRGSGQPEATSSSVSACHPNSTAASIANKFPDSPPPPYLTPPGSRWRNIDTLEVSPLSNSISDEDVRDSTMIRNSWLYSSADYPRPGPSNEVQGLNGLSSQSTPDSSTLGAYVEDYAVAKAVENSTQTYPPPQSSSSTNVSTNISPTCSASFESAGVTPAGNNPTSIRSLACACEGACGCANHVRYLIAAFSEPHILESMTKSAVARCSLADINDESPKNRIIKLLGSSRSPKSYCGKSLNSSSQGFGKTVVKRLIYPSDNCIAKHSIVSTTTNYKKFSEDAKLVSSSTSAYGSLASSPRLTPRKFTSRPMVNHHHPTCDLSSLYESIRVLDSFLARKGIKIDNSKDSMSVNLFGTPKHRRRSSDAHSEDDERHSKHRICRSSNYSF